MADGYAAWGACSNSCVSYTVQHADGYANPQPHPDSHADSHSHGYAITDSDGDANSGTYAGGSHLYGHAQHNADTRTDGCTAQLGRTKGRRAF